MKQEIKNKFPEWIKEDTKYNLMLSDDIDSLFSCVILNFIKGYKINSFYNFNSIYIEENAQTKHTIGVDADLVHNKCWGNHVQLDNKDSANLNTVLGISQTNYTQKFAGSTLLQILSYYNVDINNCTEQQLEFLISVDVAFKQYYFNKNLFIKYYDNILQYPQFIGILQKHTKDYFYSIIKKYNLAGKIWVTQDGTLDTDIHIHEIEKLFPKLDFCGFVRDLKFKKTKDFKIVQASYLQHNKEKIFSCARTYRNALRYSIY